MASKRKPLWLRLLESCPDCGLLVHNGTALLNGEYVSCFKGEGQGFDCPRCKAHYANEDYWDEQHDKHAHVWSDKFGTPCHAGI